ncbi:hypothetical protein PC114_g12280 [Phytophthora cactorum]|uniref:DUF6818 domain-containing protein n=2 Tax=Phytophthora cactorum TaxID=29920 RepID=A0A8T1BNE7_9STRA|nr:hypothetical protein PC114_g12280 [Phytophthora cactorum]KAG2907165.1 hypothetical protein PC117_g20281 [Phytophthora cactorum]KAG3179787.1 hypothetical protein C6341_g7325 [Phytophthora cactorum]KAG4044902.1 hypothetical protein PC123_g19681 [Phytophthora cactorum]
MFLILRFDGKGVRGLARMPKTKTKGTNFTTSEVIRLLNIVEEVLPFGSEQWQNVASRFNTNIPSGWTERDDESLKRKFQKLVRVPNPSGMPL